MAASPYPRTDLQMAYFRTWHDRVADPAKPNCFGDIPAEVDVAFVFPDFTPPENPFWDVLREEYVPALHERGTAVVRTTDIGTLLDPAFPDTPSGHRALAEKLVGELVHAHGLDGLDVDMENRLEPAAADRAAAVFHELSRLLGKESGTDSLLIYDTNLGGDEPVFRDTAELYDYVLVQAYGRKLETLQPTWDTFAPLIPAERYLIGFSFYEEFDLNRWDDTSEPVEDSRALAYAQWQPAGETKAGVFSYAIDRDGVAFLDDEITATEYPWTRLLSQHLRGS
ncbi:endo-beta-N-acetylglucosaminidase [Brachybacterium vulturis]|uniref:mannosyl-glycoprotein endo-beta-N-acetylglucosaminidase n=1 Tax=Brachybacterium vulturis TaxID=2017484 RepID=A0A291GMN4_9MICO|nr:endo-beta-N-acetylglucosaminidase [Brachybacterium vulturis]ATG51485.1 endo-beta-N-acetylglucosaminidase [Brachybacterium vulturis]